MSLESVLISSVTCISTSLPAADHVGSTQLREDASPGSQHTALRTFLQTTPPRQPPLWRREERAHPRLSSCPPLDTPSCLGQSVSILSKSTMCSSPHGRWRKRTMHIRSHTTQVALTQTRDLHVGELAHGAPTPL